MPTADDTSRDRLLEQPPQPLRVENAEVFYLLDPDRHIGAADIHWLKQVAGGNPRRRARFCLHSDITASVHEMVIAHHSACFVPPHAHQSREESLHVLEGRARLILFGETGSVVGVRVVGGEGASRLCRIRADGLHALLIDSDWFVFHEVTAGPFRRSDTRLPDWVPNALSEAEGVAWLEAVVRKGTAR